MKMIHVIEFPIDKKTESYWFYKERVITITGDCPVLPKLCSISSIGQHVPKEKLKPL
jgi:hypothetical protein